MKGTDPSKDRPAPGEIKNDRNRGRMYSLRGRSAPFSRLDCAKRLVVEFACPVLCSTTAHSTVFSVIRGWGRMLPKRPAGTMEEDRPGRGKGGLTAKLGSVAVFGVS